MFSAINPLGGQSSSSDFEDRSWSSNHPGSYNSIYVWNAKHVQTPEQNTLNEYCLDAKVVRACRYALAKACKNQACPPGTKKMTKRT